MRASTPNTSSATKRITRSAALTGSGSPKPEKPHDLPQLTLQDLIVSCDSKDDTLISQFPGRGQQIEELLRLLGPAGSPSLPLFIYGSPSTGKTSVIIQTLRSLRRPVLYANCLSCYCPRLLFESIINQLYLHRPYASNNYSFAKRCNKPSEFLNLVREGLANLPDAEENEMRIMYLVFDNLEAIRGWEKSSILLSFLFNLHEMLRFPTKLVIIFVSSLTPDSYYCSDSTTAGYLEPIPVYFPDYTEDELRLILMKDQVADKKRYTSFLNVVLSRFTRVSRRLTDISASLHQLYNLYCEPLKDMETMPDEVMSRKLFKSVEPNICHSLNQTICLITRPSLDSISHKEKDSSTVEVFMSKSAKYLLLSAFLASRNPATLDASHFDSADCSNTRKRKRKTSEKSLARQEAAFEDMLIKGPGTFPLERLIAIFQCITTELDISEVEAPVDKIISGSKEGDKKFMCDVLLQLSSLCTSNFIIKSENCPLDCVPRYRSTISEDFALKVARSIQFPLPNYLYRI